jgi:hypothetical protein
LLLSAWRERLRKAPGIDPERHRGSAGRFSVFHTPEDVPERTTTHELLERAYHATLAAARIVAKPTC